MKELSEYNLEITRMYRIEGLSREEIANQLAIPAEHVYNIIRLVYGVKEPMAPLVQVKIPETAPVELPVNPTLEQMEAKEQENAEYATHFTPEEVADIRAKEAEALNKEKVAKLAKILESRSNETFKKLVETLKNTSKTFSSKDRAFFKLMLIYDVEYRQKYETIQGLSGVEELITEHGKEKSIRPITKKEQQLMNSSKKYFEKLVEQENGKRSKRIEPLYLKEIHE